MKEAKGNKDHSIRIIMSNIRIDISGFWPSKNAIILTNKCIGCKNGLNFMICGYSVSQYNLLLLARYFSNKLWICKFYDVKNVKLARQ